MKVLSPINFNHSREDSRSAVVATASLTSLFSVPISGFRTMKILIQTVMGTDYATREILAIHNGTNGYITEYAIVSSNEASALMTDVFSADVLAGNFHLYITPSSATSRTLSMHLTLIK